VIDTEARRYYFCVCLDPLLACADIRQWGPAFLPSLATFYMQKTQNINENLFVALNPREGSSGR
jgi:hypothetical protein